MTAFEYAMEPDEAVKSSIREILRAYNREHFEILDEREIAITAKDDDGAVVGGVYGTMFGQWLEIEVLAVAPGHRGRGVGSDLLSRIEQAGREHGCRYALLNTFDFQGRDFYPKYGYRQIGGDSGLPADRQPALVRQGSPLIASARIPFLSRSTAPSDSGALGL